MIADQARFSRLGRCRTLRGGGHRRLGNASIAVAGAGMVGQRFVEEAVLAGVGRVLVCDFDHTEVENLGAQRGAVGVAKVDSLAARCEDILPGHVIGQKCDIRHVGPGQLLQYDLLVDTTDDPSIELALSSLSNGLGHPKLRIAVDGSGQSELGRVNCSHGAAGRSCGVCSYSLADVLRHHARTPCLGPAAAARHTYASGAIASAIVGVGLLSALRLMTGNEIDQVLDHELVLDLDNLQLLSIRRPRSSSCISGHVAWQLTRLPHRAETATLGVLMSLSQTRLGQGDVTLEPYAHPLCVSALCECGHRADVVGARWAPSPRCGRCGGSMQWCRESQYHRLDKAALAELEIADRPLTELGMPACGAMFVARVAGKPPLRLVLA